jgi:two-component system KDP operon response regulator KdpE
MHSPGLTCGRREAHGEEDRSQARDKEIGTMRDQKRDDGRRRILIIERDPDNRESLGMLLEARGHDVYLAATGERAIALAAKRNPDIVLFDFGLPDMDAHRAIAAIKSMRSTPFVIAYTGFHTREREARAAGCDAFVLKPSVELIIAILEALDPKPSATAGSLH